MLSREGSEIEGGRNGTLYTGWISIKASLKNITTTIPQVAGLSTPV
jgi:hypothetical protein